MTKDVFSVIIDNTRHAQTAVYYVNNVQVNYSDYLKAIKGYPHVEPAKAVKRDK